tara:strand:- start:317 stop:589 length:273 start_codon:yes stop_codon:yes gene_type:complete
MLHPEYGILPKTSSVHFQKYEVGISFAMKKSVFDSGCHFESSHDEDYNLLCYIRDRSHKMVMSPYIKYFVHNTNHTERHPETGSRIVINR